MPRGTGKTYQLIKLSAETGDTIICTRIEECNKIDLDAQEMGLLIPFPLTYNEFINKRYLGKHIKGFLIDNIELLIQEMCNVPVNAITISSE